MRCHFDSAPAMNWSMITCAPLTKSPNCASHTTRRRGSALDMPYSKPSTASSESGLFTASKEAWSGARMASGTQAAPVSASKSAAWRWLKVPRTVSWPERRTGKPSSSKVP